MKKTTLEVNIQHENLNLMGLINQVKGLEKEIVEQVVRDVEKEEVEKLCGEEYERTRYQRHGSKTRTFKTSVGTLELNLTRVRDKETGEVFSPAERKLKMPKEKVVLGDVSLESIEQISKLSYRKAVKTVKELSHSDLSKSTLWRRVQDLEISTELKSDVDVIMVDDTKVHKQGEDGFHFLDLVLGYNTEEDEYSLLFAGVNEEWSEIREELEKEVDLGNAYVVCDSDREINDAFEGAKGIQICHFHAVKYVDYCLWKEDAPKNFRKKMRGILKSRLQTLQNSVEKFWQDRDTERLKDRISWFREEIDRWVERAEGRDFMMAANYIRRVREKLLTFAKAALEEEEDYVPYTNNKEEREFRENAYRTKRIGGSWSEHGLRNVSLCQLISRLDERLFKKLKEVYLGEIGTLNFSVNPAGG
ncbi:hypothetical protein AKJ57_04305 [candidate division MSBL1 archaeon SCGC-AAA259A05]|uniref:Transposase n=1 Tax=candidate division MSBL1 archaeon SCGC-AAA259A05 TaxID=1698259 RepID=A0A133U7T7_9EURY|nr:hypothetical protein AKJ57_04305 [candidate division MSBL1 archaeon SCGC-AAA259A05]